MKHLRETFTDEEFARLKQAKGSVNWHDFILTLAKEETGCEGCRWANYKEE